MRKLDLCMLLALVFLVGISIGAPSVAKILDVGTEASYCVDCRNTEKLRKDQFEASQNITALKDVVQTPKTTQSHIQLSTVFGNSRVVSLNRYPPKPNEFDSSTAVCMLNVPSDPNLGGNAIFVGKRIGNLITLITNKHNLVAKSYSPQQMVVELKCGSNGVPPKYAIDEIVRINIEAEGRYNESGEKEYREEDVAVFTIDDSKGAFKSFKHFSYPLTETPDDFESTKSNISGATAFGVLRSQAIADTRITIPLKNGTKSEFYADEVVLSDPCALVQDEGGIWSHTCPNLPGFSGSPIHIDRNGKSPILVGLNSRSLGEGGHALLYDPNEGGNSRNWLVPVVKIQEIIKRENKEFWAKLKAAEEDDINDDTVTTSNNNSTFDRQNPSAPSNYQKYKNRNGTAERRTEF